MSEITIKIARQIADELKVKVEQTAAAIGLLDQGSTVPFIARYRKEVTGSLDDAQLRTLETRLGYLRELEDRRSTILKSISEQGKLTSELEFSVLNAKSKVELEDLYLPYKPKKKSKALSAIEAGLEPLLEKILADRKQDPKTLAESYLNPEKGITDTKLALDGAKAIIIERCCENAGLLSELRNAFKERAEIKSEILEGKQAEGAKFSDYFDFSEAISKIPSHRILALLRGRNAGILKLSLILDGNDSFSNTHPALNMICRSLEINPQSETPGDKWLFQSARSAWITRLSLNTEIDMLIALQEKAEDEAIKVFATNLKDLLLAAPAGSKRTIGLDPGIRTGVKVAVIDETGKVIDSGTIYPHEPKNQWTQSVQILAALCARYSPELIGIGNGTASRETDKLVSEMLSKHPEIKAKKVIVSEAGASVYSASEVASLELPKLDVTIRGAVSIARRLQDPLAELVKIDPKSIGVGQYQHDVSQTKLAKSLDNVVEDCVNAVGVDLNTASAPLLTRVSGLSTSIAKSIVEFREQNGAFKNRADLLNVPRLGQKAYEQCAGFLKIQNGTNPLDNSAVHPEAYPIVESLLKQLDHNIKDLIGNLSLLKKVNPTSLVTDDFGVETVKDILKELEKPGRDPRPEFKTAQLNDDINEIKDLKLGIILEGTVTNVTNFGAFVDVGVHQDGLVHISALSDKFVKDPATIVKAGQIVKVKVVELDIDRKRIGLSMRLSDEPGATRQSQQGSAQGRQGGRPFMKAEQPKGMGAFGLALQNALQKRV